eukprot:gene4753-2347_t
MGFSRLAARAIVLRKHRKEAMKLVRLLLSQLEEGDSPSKIVQAISSMSQIRLPCGKENIHEASDKQKLLDMLHDRDIVEMYAQTVEQRMGQYAYLTETWAQDRKVRSRRVNGPKLVRSRRVNGPMPDAAPPKPLVTFQKAKKVVILPRDPPITLP